MTEQAKTSSPPLKIVALASYGMPILYNNLIAFEESGIRVDAVIATPARKEHLALFNSRTDGHYPEKDVSDLADPSIPFYFVPSHMVPSAIELMKKLAPDLVINLGTPNILKDDLLSIARLGNLNCHPGLLPDYRGCTCLEWAVYNDDPVGATCHFMTEKIDDGPIVVKQAMKVTPSISYEKLRSDIVCHATEVMVEGVKKVAERRMGQTDYSAQGEGVYHHVISNDKLEVVKEKLRLGEYHSK